VAQQAILRPAGSVMPREKWRRQCVPVLVTGDRTFGAVAMCPDHQSGLAELRSRDLAYKDVGATSTDLPEGFVHVRRSVQIGQGRRLFEIAGTE
jgi:hypothetical protein